MTHLNKFDLYDPRKAHYIGGMLILASQSPYRKQQLTSLGLHFEAHSPLVDEEALKGHTSEGRLLAEFLAEKKAESLRTRFPDAWILGADQLVSFKGEILGKPGTIAKAVEQLERMQGQSHDLVTSYCLSGPRRVYKMTNITTLHMRALTREQIEAYVALDQPLDCAGAYKWEKNGLSLFSSVASSDFTAIQGLPLIAFCNDWFEISGQLPFMQS